MKLRSRDTQAVQPEIKREIPHVQEQQPAHTYSCQPEIRRKDPAHHRGILQGKVFTDQTLCEVDTFFLPVQLTDQRIQRDPDRKQNKGNRQYVRMQVPQFKREHRELIDHFLDRPLQPDVTDDTGGPPPPDAGASGRVPSCRTGRKIGKFLQAEPGPEGRGPVCIPEKMQGMEDLQQSFQISRDQHKERRQQGTQSRKHLSAFCRFPQEKQIIQNSKSPRSSHPKHRGQHQVEAGRGKNSGKHHQHSAHDIAEIIIGDRITGKPGIMRREGFGSQDAVDEHHLHGFFRSGNLRTAHAESQDQHKPKQKNQFGYDAETL